MKVRQALLHGRVVVEAEGDDVKQLWKQLGQAADAFEADSACGACGSANIRLNCRTVDKFDYYEIKCVDCGAELSFGQRMDGGLFPKRKDDDGRSLGSNGWRKYQAKALEPTAVFSDGSPAPPVPPGARRRE